MSLFFLIRQRDGNFGRDTESMNSVIQQNMDALALHPSNEQIRREYLAYAFMQEERALANNVPYDSKLLIGDDISKRLTEINGTTKLKSGKKRIL